jgi:hypothetical protein
MPITTGTVAVGEAVWRAIAPWKRIKQARNKRRKRLGKVLLPITEDDDKMLPKHFMTGGGIVAVAIGFVLTIVGVGECSPQDVAEAVQSCVAPGTVDRVVAGLNDVLVGGGAVVTALGKKRAMKREAELEAKAAAAKATE